MLFHASDLLLTNDGGPGHFASLTPIRTLMFFGPETGKLYGPLPGTYGPKPRSTNRASPARPASRPTTTA